MYDINNLQLVIVILSLKIDWLSKYNFLLIVHSFSCLKCTLNFQSRRMYFGYKIMVVKLFQVFCLAIKKRLPLSLQKPFNPFPVNTETGSGDTEEPFFGFDDEDIPKRLPGSAPRPSKPNIIQAGSTQQNFATRTSTPKSAANIYKSDFGVVLLNCLMLIAYIFPSWIT